MRKRVTKSFTKLNTFNASLVLCFLFDTMFSLFVPHRESIPMQIVSDNSKHFCSIFLKCINFHLLHSLYIWNNGHLHTLQWVQLHKTYRIRPTGHRLNNFWDRDSSRLWKFIDIETEIFYRCLDHDLSQLNMSRL